MIILRKVRYEELNHTGSGRKDESLRKCIKE